MLLCLTVTLLAIPAGVAVLGDASTPKPRKKPRQGPLALGRPAPEHRAVELPTKREEELAPQVVRQRSLVADLTTEPNQALANRLRTGTESERLIAANVLWARNERALVEAVAEETGDRLLLAKVYALQHRSH